MALLDKKIHVKMITKNSLDRHRNTVKFDSFSKCKNSVFDHHINIAIDKSVRPQCGSNRDRGCNMNTDNTLYIFISLSACV